MRFLDRIEIQGFKSIREQALALGPLNVFIGGNGSGKSNLIEVFRFLREIVGQNQVTYTAVKGGANTLLHFGRKRTQVMSFRLEFGARESTDTYEVALTGTNQDSLVISKEEALCHVDGFRKMLALLPGTANAESYLKNMDHPGARQILNDIESCRVYHFHDTSETAGMKGTCDVEDNRFLRPQAENLAAFLYWMKLRKPDHYATIRDTTRQIAPFFDDFQLEPSRLNPDKIRLEWKEKGSDSYFNATSFSDGTLRFICLATLLLQPQLPALVLLDEPELGLHPAAILLLANLLLSVSTKTQAIVATQSVTLINQFDQDVVWAVDRNEGQSVFRHLKDEDMSAWLDGYALGDLWEKNVLGARP